MKWFKKIVDPTVYDGDFVPLTAEENARLCKSIAIVGGISIAVMIIIVILLWK